MTRLSSLFGNVIMLLTWLPVLKYMFERDISTNELTIHLNGKDYLISGLDYNKQGWYVKYEEVTGYDDHYDKE